MRRTSRLLLVTLAPLPTALVAALLVGEARDSARYASAQRLLLEGDTDSARAGFERLEWSPSHWHAARLGLGVTAYVAGDEPLPGPPSGTASFRIGLLLHAALAKGDYGAVERLADLAGAGDGSPAIYRAAAALERGDTERARSLLAAVSPGLRGAGLGARIERALEREARGATTMVFDRRGAPVGALDALGRFQLEPAVDPAWIPRALPPLLARTRGRAAGLRVGLDLELSRMARASLGRSRGTIVLLDLETGSVLAAVSDDRTLRRIDTPALEQLREPASIAKLITTTAALRAGLDPDAEISRMRCSGSIRYPGGTLWCPAASGELHGLDHAMAVSCNSSFARLGALVGREDLVAEFRRFGFDRGALELPGSGRIVQPEGDERQLADLAIGLEATAITPLHAALLAAVFGNGGTMPEPRFVTAWDGRLGLSPAPLPRPAHRPVADPEWLPVLLGSMRAVAAPGGTGAGLAPARFPVAMKTGTAAEYRKGYHVNYVGFGPLPAPRIAFCVRLTHVGSSLSVNRAARRVTRDLLSGLARHAARLGAFAAADPRD